ncbi:MAG TPA: hypothetical protein VL485_18700 [Ktedonobacteraceae bacterium]|nr:hypothetical protein [Ktedonobacteraceae bacterium]
MRNDLSLAQLRLTESALMVARVAEVCPGPPTIPPPRPVGTP